MSLPSGLAAGSLVLATAAVAHAGVAASRRTRALRRVEQPAAVGDRPLADVVPAPSWLAPRLESAALSLDASSVWLAWLGATLAAAVIGAVLVGPGLGVGAGVVVGAAPAAVLWSMRARADRALEAALPEGLEAIARGLRTGGSLRQAVGEAGQEAPGRLGTDLRSVADEVAHGTPLLVALDAWGERRPLPGVRLAVAALGLGAETGGAQARAVDGVAATLRSHLGVTAEVRALSSQARLSGLVIAVAPLGFALFASATDDTTATFLFRTPVGLACLGLGLGLDAVAALWMNRLAKVEP